MIKSAPCFKRLIIVNSMIPAGRCAKSKGLSCCGSHTWWSKHPWLGEQRWMIYGEFESFMSLAQLCVAADLSSRFPSKSYGTPWQFNNQDAMNTKSHRISPNVSIETRLRSFPELFKSSLHSGTRPDIPSTRILHHWGIEASHWKSSTLAHYLQGFTRIHPRSCRISMNF